MFALVLTGPPGAGKTSVLEALSDALTAEDVRHATLEVEAITSAHPPLGDDQWVMPVEAICGLYRRFGYDLLLVTATVESAEDLRTSLRRSPPTRTSSCVCTPDWRRCAGASSSASPRPSPSSTSSSRPRRAWPR